MARLLREKLYRRLHFIDDETTKNKIYSPFGRIIPDFGKSLCSDKLGASARKRLKIKLCVRTAFAEICVLEIG